jgi:excisionase family DNA binding protein
MPLDPVLAHAPAHVLPRLLEVSAVAHRLSVSPEYVRDLIRDKKLPAIRLGRYWRVDPRDLEAFIDRQRQHAEGDPR